MIFFVTVHGVLIAVIQAAETNPASCVEIYCRSGAPRKEKENTSELQAKETTAAMASASAPSSSHPLTLSSRKFCERWRYNDSGAPRTWLEFKEGVMFCSVCHVNAKDLDWILIHDLKTSP